jgi:TRAP-type uncharacterized transport system substrate-binding protein
MTKVFMGAMTVAMLMATTGAMAAKAEDAPAAACTGLKVATGPAGKGYSAVFKDVKAVCGATVQLCEVNTNGAVDNLPALSTKEADIGFATVDTWAKMKQGDENIAGLQAIMGLNFNYLHVVVASRGFEVQAPATWGGMVKGDKSTVVIQKFSELRGRKVAAVGSGQLLGRVIDKQGGYNLQIVDVETDAQALDMVKKGQVAAVFTVSGWPSGVLRGLKQDAGVTLVPFDVPTGDPIYQVRQVSYKGLGVFNNNALAIPNVLFTRPFKGEKAAEVSKLRSCLREKLEILKEGDFAPAWNEIKSADNTFDVPKFAGPAASPAATAQAPTVKKK